MGGSSGRLQSAVTEGFEFVDIVALLTFWVDVATVAGMAAPAPMD